MLRSIRRAIISSILLISFVILAFLGSHFMAAPVSIGDLDSSSFQLEANQSTILRQGDCIALNWQADGLASLAIDGEIVAHTSTYDLCPDMKDLPRVYEIVVDFTDGRQSTYTFEIQAAIPGWCIILATLIAAVATLHIAHYVVKHRYPESIATDTQETVIQDNLKLKRALYLAIIFTPICLVMFMLWILQGAAIYELMPVFNDGALYWHQAASYAESGFDSGYYANYETPAPAEFSPFFAWGAGIPIFYGTLFQIMGTSLASIPIINLACLTVALAFFILSLRPTIQQLWWLWLLVATFPFIYSPALTSMLPLLELSVAIVAAALFCILLSKGQQASIWVKIGLGLALVCGVIVRPYWGVLFLPYFLLLFPKFRILAIGVSGVAFLGGVMLQGWWSAYHPFFVSTVVIETFQAGDRLFALFLLWSTIDNNLTALVTRYDVNGIAIAYRLSILFIIGIAIAIIRFYEKHHRKLSWTNPDVRVSLFSLYVFFAVFVLMNSITVLDNVSSVVSKDLRYISPFVLMILMILLMTDLRRYVIFSFVPLVLVIPLTVSQFNAIAGVATSLENRQRMATTHETFHQTIQVDEDAPNRWCNTLLAQNVPYIHDVPFMLAINEGLGISWDPNNRLPNVEKFRSQYLALTDDMLQEMSARDQLEPIADLPEGKLYLNLESDCEP